MSEPWSQQQLSTLKQMHGVYSMREIARVVGKSRNSVISKSNNLGMKVAIHQRQAFLKGCSFEPLPVVPAKPKIAQVECKPVTLEKRKGCCCPVGDSKPQLYCNNPVSSPVKNGTWQYCDAHKSVMFDTGRSYHPKAVRRAGKVNGSGWV